MKIHSLELKNIGIHRNLKFEPGDASVVGLIGKNGQGKSTILNSLKFLFSGILDDVSESIVTHGCDKGYAHADFTLMGKEGSIRRSVGKTKTRTLEWDGKSYKTATEVEAVLEQIFGVDKQAMSNACFIMQGSLDELLFGRPAEREALFTKLVNMSFCDKRRGMVDAKMNTVLLGVEDLSALRDELNASHEAAVAAVKRLGDELSGKQNCSEMLVHLKNIANTVGRMESVRDGVARREVVVASLVKELETLPEAHSEGLEKLEGRISAESDRMDILTGQSKEIAGKVSQVKACDSLRQRIVESKKQLQEDTGAWMSTLTELSQLKPVTHDMDALHDAHSTLQIEVQQLGDWITLQEKMLAGQGSDCGEDCMKCTSCGLKLSPDNNISADNVLQCRELFDKKTQELLQSGNRKVKAQEEIDSALQGKQVLTSKVDNLVFRMDQAKKSIQNMESELSQYDISHVDIDALVEENGKLDSELEDIRIRLDKLRDIRTRYINLKGRISENERTISEENLKLLELNTQVQASQLKLEGIGGYNSTLTLSDYEQMQAEYNEAVGQLTQAQDHMSRVEISLSELNDRESKQVQKRAVASKLDTLKKILTKDAYPRDVLNHKFERLAGLTSEALNTLGADFSIDIDKDSPVAFNFRRFDGTSTVELPMRRLSGGQKVRLCIAFLLAVQRDLVPNVGFQTFDEPSTHLDEEGVTQLGELFLYLRSILQSTDHQVWVCDHHPMMHSYFEKTLIL
jgi:DNA repair exonuclease SbcCD ATPase subunit